MSRYSILCVSLVLIYTPGSLLTCVPGSIGQPVPEACQHIHDDKNRVRRVHTGDHVGDDVAGRTENRDASLAVLLVDRVVEEGGEGVSDKGRQEDERHESVLEAVV